jgi:hypothetical protein
MERQLQSVTDSYYLALSEVDMLLLRPDHHRRFAEAWNAEVGSPDNPAGLVLNLKSPGFRINLKREMSSLEHNGAASRGRSRSAYRARGHRRIRTRPKDGDD